MDIVHAYERNVFVNYRPANTRFRELLRYRREVSGASEAIQSVKTATPETYDNVCVYVSALRLIETLGMMESWWAENRVGYVPKPLLVLKSLTQEMLENRNTKVFLSVVLAFEDMSTYNFQLSYWDKIADLPYTLAKISQSVKALKTRTYNGTLPVLRHLLDLAIGEAKSEIDFIVENFRVVSWNLSFIFTPQLWSEEGDSSNTGQMIPDLPRNWDSLIISLARMEQMQQDDLETITRFLETKGTAGRIRVVLQLVLLISPVYILAPASLRGAAAITKQKIYEVC